MLDNISIDSNLIQIKDYKSNFDRNKPCKFFDVNMIPVDVFNDKLSNYNVKFSDTSNVANLVGSIRYGDFLIEKNDNYVFHKVSFDKNIIDIIEKLIPLPDHWDFVPNKIKDLRISRLYAGDKHCGVNLHAHSPALNYLVGGKKMWIMFPPSEKNKKLVIENNMRYSEIEDKTINWLMTNYDLLYDNIENLKVFTQDEREIVYIPDHWFHSIINIEYSVGVVYSWLEKNND